MTSLADAQRIRDLEERVRVVEDELLTYDQLLAGLRARLEALEAPASAIDPAVPLGVIKASGPPPAAKPKRPVPPAFLRWQEQQRKAKEKEAPADA
jgi:hypothetical protein